jgi:hypothetical protein
MKYNANITSTKGTHRHGQYVIESDPDENGVLVTRAESEVLARTLGGRIQDINEHFWLLRIDANHAQGTVLVINGGSQMVSVFAVDDLEEGLFYPTSSLQHWTRNNFNVALLMSDVGTPWGWNYYMYYDKNVDGQVVDAVFKKLYNREISSARYREVFQWFWAIAESAQILRQEHVPIHINGHCSGAILVTKYASLSNDYDFASMTLISPIFNDHFDNPVAHYMDFMRYNTSVPLLIVNHAQDTAAGVSIPHSNRLLEHAKPKCNHVILDGGLNIGSPNFTLSYHGFYGIVDQLVDVIADHIVR